MKLVCNCGATADGNWRVWRMVRHLSFFDDQFVRVWVKDGRIIGVSLDAPGLRRDVCCACNKEEYDKYWADYEAEKLRKKQEKLRARDERQAQGKHWWQFF